MVKITIDTGNAAFQDGSKGLELAHILRGLARKLEDGHGNPVKLYDSNGNQVGQCIGTGPDKNL